MIIQTRDHRALIRETGADLRQWHPDIADFNWPATLAQPNWTLLTDGEGSWCLLHPIDPEYGSGQHRHLEAHLIISPQHRGRAGIKIARAMLAWIDLCIGPETITAKAPARSTRLFLRWIGFVENDPGIFSLTVA